MEKGFLFFKHTEKEIGWAAFWDYLDKNGTAQSDYEYSTRAFLDFDQILMEKERMIWDYCDPGISQRLSETRNSSIAEFCTSYAQDVFGMLRRIEISKSYIAELLRDEDLSPDEGEFMNEAIFAAYEKALEWFSLIGEGEVGTLIFT